VKPQATGYSGEKPNELDRIIDSVCTAKRDLSALTFREVG